MIYKETSHSSNTASFSRPTSKAPLLTLSLLLILTLFALPAAAVEEGDQAPDFTLPDIQDSDRSISLSDYRGKTVYVDFWASWCAPCLRSLPAINDLYHEYRDQGFEVIAVNVDNPVEDGLDFLADTPLDFLIAADPAGEIPERYDLLGMPTSYLVDPEGNVRLVHMGFREGDIEVIEEEVREVMGL